MFQTTGAYQYNGVSTNLTQMWKICYLSNGQYSIRSYMNDRMGLAPSSIGSNSVSIINIGTSETLSGVNSTARWTITTDSSGMTIKNVSSGKVLATPSGSTNLYDGVILLDYAAGASETNQRWILVSASSVAKDLVVFDAEKNVYLTSSSTIKLYTGEFYNVKAAYESSGAVNQTMTWSSSNDLVAIVNIAGGIKAKGAGTTVITVKHDASGLTRSFNVEVLKDAIIIVPGIMCSQIFANGSITVNGKTFSDGTRLWDPSTSELSSVSDKIRALAMNSSGTPVYSTRINSPTVNQKDKTANGFQYGAQDMYRDLYTELYDSFYSSTCDIVLFEYDWREHPYDTALELNSFINNSHYEKVTFVSHSMGGIVSSFYLSLGSTQRNHVKKHISIGTPYLGAAKMADVFLSGKAIEVEGFIFKPIVSNILTTGAIRDIIGNIPSIYALLPYEQHWNLYAGLWASSVGTTVYLPTYNETINSFKQYMPNWNDSMMQNARNLNSRLFTSTEQHITSLVDSYYIVGQNLSTIYRVSFLVVDGKYTSVDGIKNSSGDGTVTLQSSTVDGSLDSSRIYYRTDSSDTDASHTGMVTPDEYDGTTDRANKIAKTAIPQIISLIKS